MRFRPANISVINRRDSRLDRPLDCLTQNHGHATRHDAGPWPVVLYQPGRRWRRGDHDPL